MSPREQSDSSRLSPGSEPDNVENDATSKHNGNADQIPEYEPIEGTSLMRSESFVDVFIQSNGPPQIVLLIMLIALGIGSTIGVVPAVMADRYARLNHAFEGDKLCAEYDVSAKPEECLLGSADAQNAVALENLISSTLTFFSSSLVGSLSDEYGRKGILVLGVSLSLLSPLSLVLLQVDDNMSPMWYYGAGAVTGLVNWFAVALSSFSDIMPPKWRAPSFGLLLAGFSLGFALSPILALLLGHFLVSIVAFFLVLLGLVVVVFAFPETLPPEAAAEAKMRRAAQTEDLGTCEKIVWMVQRPLWELSILNRSKLFRMLSLLAFFSGLVSAGDRTLLLYYIEEHLGFTDKDVAILFLIMGVLGIFVQGVVLKFLNDAIGERWVVTASFALGTVHNLMYGFAKTKMTIFLAIAVGSFVGMSFPTISAIKSNNVDNAEQGRIQGALYSLSALASAIGPLTLQCVYRYTKDGALFGPGTMFVFASSLYALASFCGYMLPYEVNTHKGLGATDSVRDENLSLHSSSTHLI